jgi:putative cardiolipin synthase
MMAANPTSLAMPGDQAEQLMKSALRRIGIVAAWIVFMLIAGCAGLPADVQRAASQGVDGARTSLAQIAERSAADEPTVQATQPEHNDLSGLRLIADGDHALATRLALIRRAESSLDLQYYQIASDATGLLVLRELGQAAARGVRVRLLVDDLYAAGQDELFAALAARANVQVRMFNPLPVRSGGFAARIALSLHEFERINRRMHNKLFIADGRIAVAGGRNLADEYFMRSEQANFIDMDVLATGAVVPQLVTLFDRFWNSEQAYPIEALAAAQAGEDFDAIALRLAESTTAPAQPIESTGPATDRLGRIAIPLQLSAGRLQLTYARVQLLADEPAKAAGAATRTTRDHAAEAMGAAERELMIVSPYFVPGEQGMAMLKTVAHRGATLTVTTNSLGATDEPLVHAGYSRYRVAMLKMGVHLRELGATLSRKTAVLGNFRSSQGRLHAKLAVIDGQRLFIGSMNMDGRSARFNTELGLLIDSPELAAEAADLFKSGAQAAAYRLRLAEGGERIEWLAQHADREVAHTDEPDLGLAQGLKLSLLGALVDEDLL